MQDSPRRYNTTKPELVILGFRLYVCNFVFFLVVLRGFSHFIKFQRYDGTKYRLTKYMSVLSLICILLKSKLSQASESVLIIGGKNYDQFNGCLQIYSWHSLLFYKHYNLVGIDSIRLLCVAKLLAF